MKKEYKAPQLSIVNVMVEGLMQIPASQQQDNEWANSKKKLPLLPRSSGMTKTNCTFVL